MSPDKFSFRIPGTAISAAVWGDSEKKLGNCIIQGKLDITRRSGPSNFPCYSRYLVIGARHFELLPVSHGHRYLSEVKTDANLPFTHVVSTRKSSFFVAAEPQAFISLQRIPSLQYKESIWSKVVSVWLSNVDMSIFWWKTCSLVGVLRTPTSSATSQNICKILVSTF